MSEKRVHFYYTQGENIVLKNGGGDIILENGGGQKYQIF